MITCTDESYSTLLTTFAMLRVPLVIDIVETGRASVAVHALRPPDSKQKEQTLSELAKTRLLSTGC